MEKCIVEEGFGKSSLNWKKENQKKENCESKFGNILYRNQVLVKGWILMSRIRNKQKRKVLWMKIEINGN